MHHFLLTPPHWYVLGPLMGLVPLALVGTINERIGVLGGFSDLVERVERGKALGWKAWFLLGVIGGGLVFSLLTGRFGHAGAYGWLGRGWIAGPALIAAGVFVGFGAKTAGGCTSGNGLGGCSAGSPSSFVSTATFMAVAVGSSFLFRWLVG